MRQHAGSRGLGPSPLTHGGSWYVWVKYNRIVRKIALIAAVCLLAACKKNIQTKEAVQAGVNEYLMAKKASTGLNLDLMKVEVTSLLFAADGNSAQATVTFTPKAGGAGMSMPYSLEKKDDKWVVRQRADGENPHGGMGAPPMGGAPGENPHGG